MKHRSKTPRKPAEVFNECPACKSRDLLRLQVDVLCSDCDWMSCEEYVSMGGMDNLFAAYKDHFPVNQEDELVELVAQQRRDLIRSSDEREPICPVEVSA